MGGAPEGEREIVRCAAAGVLTVAVMAATPAAGQSAPGPWVLDVRAATSGVPGDAAFYPTLTAAAVPSRGYGADIGGHFYAFTIGPGRVGFGANVLIIRSTATAAAPSADPDSSQRLTVNLRTISPQISFNFGSRDGWSYLSAGLGVASIATETRGAASGSVESGWLRSVNFGGGARWFIKPRLAFGFDVRAHKIAAGSGTTPTPASTVTSVSAGLSIR